MFWSLGPGRPLEADGTPVDFRTAEADVVRLEAEGPYPETDSEPLKAPQPGGEPKVPGVPLQKGRHPALGTIARSGHS